MTHEKGLYRFKSRSTGLEAGRPALKRGFKVGRVLNRAVTYYDLLIFLYS